MSATKANQGVNLLDADAVSTGTAAAPLRIDPTGTTTQPVTAASLPLPAGASTEATLSAIKAKTDNLDVALSTRAVTGLTDAQLRASSVPVSHGAATQADGHSATLGATGDADTANTVVGRLKQLVTRISGGLPTALVGGRLDQNLGAWLGATTPTVGQKTAAASLPVILASDQSALPVTQSPKEEATFTVIAEAVALGNLKSLLSIYNPAASTTILKLREFYIRNPQTTAITGLVANFRLLRWANAAAPTGGTALTPRAHDTNDTLGAGIVCGTGVTIGGTEEAQSLDLMRISTDEWGPGTLDQEGAQQTIANYLPARTKRDSVLKAFTARPGQGIHLKMATNTAVSSVDVIFVFTQV